MSSLPDSNDPRSAVDSRPVEPVTGWYVDPAGGPDLRFWDGRVWSEQTMARPALGTLSAPPPPAPRSPEAADDYFGTRPVAVAAPSLARPGYVPEPLPVTRPKPSRGALGWLRLGWRGYRLVSLTLAVLAALGYGGFRWLGGGANNGSRQVTLSAPTTIGDLTIDAQRTSQLLPSAVSRLAAYGIPAVAAYDDTDLNLTAQLIAVKRPSTDTTDPDSLIKVMQDGAGPETALASVDPGARGGRMSCGSGTYGGVPMTICIFADAGVFGGVTVVGTGSSAVGTARQIREAVEHPS